MRERLSMDRNWRFYAGDFPVSNWLNNNEKNPQMALEG